MAQYKNQGDAQMNLLEELSEVMQVITKKVRFGGEWGEIPPGHTQTRLQSLKDEMEDVMLSYSRLMEEIRNSEPKVSDYLVYHPYGGAMNHNCERGTYEYVAVYHTNANSLEDVFVKAQNRNEHYSQMGIRSTSVGDIIYSVKDEQAFMVIGRGFAPVPPTVLSYIDWTNHPEVNHEELL